MAAGRVTAAAVQVRVGQQFRMLERGAELPEGVSDEDAKRLAAKGLVKLERAGGRGKAKAAVSKPAAGEGAAAEDAAGAGDAGADGAPAGEGAAAE